MSSSVIRTSYQHVLSKENQNDYPRKLSELDENQSITPSSSSWTSSSETINEKCCYKQTSAPSFIQRYIKPKYHHIKKSPSSSLESRYGRLQNGNIGRGAYAIVKLIISCNHHYNHHPNYNHHHHNHHSMKIGVSATNSKQVYAVKIFKKKKHAEDHGKYMKRLISEYCIASSMHHPNIIKTLDLVTDAAGRYCIVMEYCSGGDLYHAIKNNKLTIPKINSYFKQLISGLDYLHSLGVAHRDVKPENLIISGDGHTLKITDFGVADVFCETWQRHSRLSDGFCGSLAFIAPEVFSLLLNRGADENYYHARVIIPSSSPSLSSLSSSSHAPSLVSGSHNGRRRRRRTLSLTSGYQASKVDVWSAAIVYCCMWFKGTLFHSAERSDPNYRVYLNSYASRSFIVFGPLEADIRSLLYQMLDPDPERRISTSQILQTPFISEIE